MYTSFYILSGVKNIKSMLSAACVKFHTLGKIIALNICCFVVGCGLWVVGCGLWVVGNARVYWKQCGKKNQLLFYFWSKVKEKKDDRLQC